MQGFTKPVARRNHLYLSGNRNLTLSGNLFFFTPFYVCCRATNTSCRATKVWFWLAERAISFEKICVVTPRYLVNDHKGPGSYSISRQLHRLLILCLRNTSDIVKFVILHWKFYQTAFWPVISVTRYCCSVREYHFCYIYNCFRSNKDIWLILFLFQYFLYHCLIN